MGRQGVRRAIAALSCAAATLVVMPVAAGAVIDDGALEPTTEPMEALQATTPATTTAPAATTTTTPQADGAEPVAAAPAVATEPGLAPTIEPRCWVGSTRPVYVVRNRDPEHVLTYVLSAPGAGKAGKLAPRSAGADATWFVGTGSFPSAGAVQLDYEINGATAAVWAPAAEPYYCTYTVRPVVRWLDANGHDVMPLAADVAGWSLAIEGPLGSLDCSWNGAGLTCVATSKPGGPLPEGSFYSLGENTELHVPAFGDTGFSVSASADPPGYRLAGGTGQTVLADLGDGLDQSTVDERASSFFPARLQTGTAAQVVTVTLTSLATGPSEVRGTSITRTDATTPAAAMPSRPARDTAPSATASAVGAPAFTLPATGGAPFGLVGLGAVLFLGGLGLAVAARPARTRRC